MPVHVLLVDTLRANDAARALRESVFECVECKLPCSKYVLILCMGWGEGASSITYASSINVFAHVLRPRGGCEDTILALTQSTLFLQGRTAVPFGLPGRRACFFRSIFCCRFCVVLLSSLVGATTLYRRHRSWTVTKPSREIC